MYGVWVNPAAILVGGAVGLLLRGGIPDRFKQIITQALALCVLVIGIMGAIKTQDMMLVIVCLVVGSCLGELMKIEAGLERLGGYAQRRLAGGDSAFAQGFISSTLLFCVGAMAVAGSLEAGLTGNGDTLMAKSMLDGVSSVIFASTLGPGVLLSALPVLVYQGLIAALARSVQQFLSPEVIGEMSAVGSLLIIALAFNMFSMTKERVKVGNMLPALLLPIAYLPLQSWIHGLLSR